MHRYGAIIGEQSLKRFRYLPVHGFKKFWHEICL